MSERNAEHGGAALWGALLLALVLRCGWIALVAGEPAFDAKTYFDLATRLLQQRAYAYEGHPTAFWPIGYPALLSALFAIFDAKLASAWALNVIAGLVSLWSMHAIALRLGFSRRVANLCVLLGALNPVYVTYSCLVVTEPVFVGLTLLAIAVGALAGASRARLLASGALLGCAALVRPWALPLPLLLGLCGVQARLTRTLALRRVAWLALGLALVVGPWTARNALELGVFAPVSTNGGMNLYIGNNPHATGRFVFEDAMAEPYLNEQYLGGARELDFDRRARTAAWSYIAEHPLQVVALWPRKLLFAYFPDLIGLTWNRPHDLGFARAVFPLVPLTIALHELLLLILVAIGIVRLRRALARGAAPGTGACMALPLGMIGVFAAFCLLYFGMPRFHFPCFPWFELLAAAALAGPAAIFAAPTAPPS